MTAFRDEFWCWIILIKIRLLDKLPLESSNLYTYCVSICFTANYWFSGVRFSNCMVYYIASMLLLMSPNEKQLASTNNTHWLFHILEKSVCNHLKLVFLSYIVLLIEKDFQKFQLRFQKWKIPKDYYITWLIALLMNSLFSNLLVNL